MEAIIPLHITALRVSATDASKVVTTFKGRTARFQKLPYQDGSVETCTGDTVLRPLESEESPQASLGVGIHLHWELPNAFRKGVQSGETGEVAFPQAPNRWLVTRYLSRYDAGSWKTVPPHSWVVESDYIATAPSYGTGARPSIPVPLPAIPETEKQPYRYMGRVVEATVWKARRLSGNYLPDFNKADGTPFYLNALGFVGPLFSSYYPDCCSVFGFYDPFTDVPEIADTIRKSNPVRFRVSYQVAGWIDGTDPLHECKKEVTKSYEQYVTDCCKHEMPVERTPVDFFLEQASGQWNWQFDADAVSFEVDKNHRLVQLEIPERTVCNGLLQDIVWDLGPYPGTTGFLGHPDRPTHPVIWEDTNARIALGNTLPESMAALLRADAAHGMDDPEAENRYEYLLNMLQSGRIESVDKGSNLLNTLEKGLHADSFATEQGGMSWVVRKCEEAGKVPQPVSDVSMPLPLVESVRKLNRAQKEYDTCRQALGEERKQLFMDWYRYIKALNGGTSEMLNRLSAFLRSSFPLLQSKDTTCGRLLFTESEVGKGIDGVAKPTGDRDSLAYRTWECCRQTREVLAAFPEWELLAVPAPVYHQSADPVISIEAERLDNRARNGKSALLPVRTTRQLIGCLECRCGNFRQEVHAEDIVPEPGIDPELPCVDTVWRLEGEARLLLPETAGEVAEALARKEGTGNPASERPEDFVRAYRQVLGGESPLEEDDRLTHGLFEKIREDGYIPVPNVVQSVVEPIALDITFTNTCRNGKISDAVGWNVQQKCRELSEKRFDPFIPVAIIWKAKIKTLAPEKTSHDYGSENLTAHFVFNAEATDYTYLPGEKFTDDSVVQVRGSSLLMKKSTQIITRRMEQYSAALSDEEAADQVARTTQELDERRIVSQTLSGFSAALLLRYYLPQIEVMNIPMGKLDKITVAFRNLLVDAAGRNDDWYAGSFHAEAPLYRGLEALNGFHPLRAGFLSLESLEALNGFHPLRAGFLSLESLEVIDTFGQRMSLVSSERNADGTLQLATSYCLSPPGHDTGQQGKAYLPPRLAVPARLLFRWLDNTHPLVSASPVCGWILPNHLDNSLFFYNSDGSAIGSFGVDHQALVYRTRVGNVDNPGDSLAIDIGVPGRPEVNAWLARLMWYIQDKSGVGVANGHFLTALMRAIENSEEFISPEKGLRDGSLAVLIGRPLAVLRAELGLETYGALLPLNPENTTTNSSPWMEDVKAGRCDYRERMKYSAASLGAVELPVRLGDRNDMDDGLVGYLPEFDDSLDPYHLGTFYAPAATGTDSGVAPPSDQQLKVTVNAEPIKLTLLLDPRAAVHAATGILPVEALELPADGFSDAAGKLQMSFRAHPFLQPYSRPAIPLPEQKGYRWGWVSHRTVGELALSPSDVQLGNGWGYAPQTLEEGWLMLAPEEIKKD
ncbi:MAG: hypothetical protein RR212_04665 [Bacteroidales bacterium]